MSFLSACSQHGINAPLNFSKGVKLLLWQVSLADSVAHGTSKVFPSVGEAVVGEPGGQHNG